LRGLAEVDPILLIFGDVRGTWVPAPFVRDGEPVASAGRTPPRAFDPRMPMECSSAWARCVRCQRTGLSARGHL